MATRRTNHRGPLRDRDLPSWARLIKPRNLKTLGKDELSPYEEERCLRTRCFHEVSRQLDLAFHDSFAALSGDALNFVCSTVGANDAHGSGKSECHALPGATRDSHHRRGTESTSPLSSVGDGLFLDHFSLATPPLPPSPSNNEGSTVVNPYAATASMCMLPVALLHGPHHRLDRLSFVEHLINKQRQRLPRTCAVWLDQQSCPDAHLETLTDFVKEIVRQCLQQEEEADGSIRQASTSKPISTASHGSLTEALVQWASRTASFDEICVWLDVPDGFHPPVVSQVLQWLSDRRARCGLPFRVAMLVPQAGRLDLQLSSASRGPVGLSVTRHVLPDAAQLLNDWWSRALRTSRLPPVTSPAEWQRILRPAFEWESHSAVQAVQRAKHVLALFFAQTGSLWSAVAAGGLEEEQTRIAWFVLDNEGRELSTNFRKGERNRSPSKTLSRRGLQDWLGKMHLLFQKIQVARQVEHLWRPLLIPGSTIPRVSPLQLLSELVVLRRSLQSASDLPRSPDLMSLVSIDACQKGADVHFVQQLIVLVGHASSISDLEEHLFRPLYQEWHTALQELVDDYTNDPETNDNRSRPSTFSTRVLASLSPQSRRDTIAGLVAEPSAHYLVSSIPFVAGHLYRLILDRTSITQSEWFTLWHFEDCAQCRGSMSMEGRNTGCAQELLQISFDRFYCGIYQLQYLGLIQERRSTSKKKEPVFDKSVLVWCGGE